MKKIITIVGSTGVGKTNLLNQLKNKFDIEIISADSRQVYKFLDIGTAKPDAQLLSELKHHLIDIIEPDTVYSSAEWAKNTKKIIDKIIKKKKVPVIAGGTGFYIKTFFDGVFQEHEKNPVIKNQLQKELKQNGKKYMYEKLLKIDKTRAQKIHPNDSYRVLRALETYYVTGKPLSELFKQPQTVFTELKPLYIGLNLERQLLYNKINERTVAMLHSGWIDEVVQVLKKGYAQDCPGLNSIGYKQIINYLNKKTDFNTMKETIQKLTRNYAKRQLVWFRKNKKIKWFSPDEKSEIIQYISDNFSRA